MEKLDELIQYFKDNYLSDYQAKRRAKAIIEWDGKSELGSGWKYTQARGFGIGIIESYKIEAIYWGHMDRISPPTPWERGLINFIEGTSTLKYNQVPLLP